MTTIPDIRTSIENKNSLVIDKHAQQGTFLRDARGRLLAYAGGFSVVFPYCTNNGEKWAFRCWHADVSNTQSRYEIISESIRHSGLSFLTDFIYEKEGIIVDGTVYPTIRMKWVEGLPIKEYICNNRTSRGILNNLADDFIRMTREMHLKTLSHGDLQHGNILVDAKNAIHLIDYDSFYCPALKGEPDNVTGLPDYQHPSRITNKVVSEKLDYFSELIIYLSIRAIAEQPSLIDKYKIKDSDRLLFSKEDYFDLEHSEIYNDIHALGGDFRELLDVLKEYLSYQDIDSLKPFETLMMERKVIFSVSSPKAVRNTQEVKLSWAVPFDASVCVSRVGDKKKLSCEKYGKLNFTLGKTETFKIEIHPKTGPSLVKLAKVDVFDKCTISFSSDKLYVFPRIPIILSWIVTDAKKVWLDGEDVPSIGQKIVVQTKNTTYVITAEDEFGKEERKLEIGMLPIPQVKSILVPIPEVTNNLSVSICQPKYNIGVEFPNIDIGMITAETPRIKTFTEMGLAAEIHLPKQKDNLSAAIERINTIKKNIEKWTRKSTKVTKLSNGADS